MDKTEKTINKLYDNLGYNDLYFGNVLFFIVLNLIIFIICAYNSVLINAQPIKNDWVAQRCNPLVMPFAGIINKPDDKSAFEFTEENFSFCVQNILTEMTGYLLEPITFLTADLGKFFNELTDSFNNVRSFLSNVRTYVDVIGVEIMGRLANIMIPLQTIIIKVKDFFGKFKGMLATALYTLIGSYSALKSLFGAIIQIIILCLLISFGMIIAAWIIGFFFFPSAVLAAGATVIYIIILALVVVMFVFMNDVMNINISQSLPGVPGKPSCFDKNTILTMNDGSLKRISEINVGDVLSNNNKVTAKLILDATKTQMYKLYGVVVSGTHRIKYKGDWIYVSEHPEKMLVQDYKESFIYCLNTESKTISVQYLEFCDWDEIFEYEWIEIKNLIHKNRKIPIDTIAKKDIHKYYDYGFIGTTCVDMNDGTQKKIKDILAGDILKYNIEVYGVVEIDATNLVNSEIHLDLDLDLDLSLDLDLENINNRARANNLEKIYHLLTDKDYFYIYRKKYYDYNYCVERALDEFKHKYSTGI